MNQSEAVEATEFGEGELPESKVLDHLGLVAGMFEELEIGDRIDEHIAQDFDQREVSVGQAVKALVPGGLRICPATALPDTEVLREGADRAAYWGGCSTGAS